MYSSNPTPEFSENSKPLENKQKDFHNFYNIHLYYDNFKLNFQTQAETIEEFLKSNNIILSSDDILYPNKTQTLYNGIIIILKRKIPLSIEVDNQKLQIKTFTRNIEDILKENHINLSELDKITPNKTENITFNEKIIITRINIGEVFKETSIPFQSIIKDDNTVEWGTKRIKQAGKNGIKRTTFQVTYKNGKEESKIKIKEEIIQNPEEEIILQGTKINVGKVSKGQASWYSHTGKLACASLEHPIGTWLRVTNQINGKQIIVQVNDRGPSAPQRIIDLDKEAFKKIGDLGAGIIKVKVEEIKQ